MIRLSFLLGRELIVFWIDKKVIWYQGSKQPKIQIIPESNEIMELRKNPRLSRAFTLRGRDKEEYDNAKTDREIEEIIRNDCRKMRMKLLKREEGWQE